jgi:hypothetical protein
MKTSELQGAALDWAVAIALGHNKQDVITDFGVYIRIKTQPAGMLTFCPSTDWSQGGPIIEREGITTAPRKEHGKRVAWVATRIEPPAVCECEGKTQLIAAMRCFVASRLGDEVNIPEELI